LLKQSHLTCILLPSSLRTCRDPVPDVFTTDKYDPGVAKSWLKPHKLQRFGCTRTATLFDMDLVIMPVHYDNHWHLQVADMRNKTVSVLDSKKNHLPQARKLALAGHFKRALAQHMEDNKGKWPRSNVTVPTEWPVRCVLHRLQPCLVFVCHL
jgi:hypothetical protein